MRSLREVILSLGVALMLLALLAIAAPVGLAQRRKNVEPKSQVQPLPPEPPRALAADTQTLDFHLSPLLKAGGLAAQIRRSLNDLIRDTHGETIIKLRAFVAGAGDARRVQAEVAQLFSEHKLPLPVLSVLQVGALGESAAQIEIEAVVATRRTVNSNGLAFFSGQAGQSLASALQQLEGTVRTTSVEPDHVLQVTCFTSRLEAYEASHAAFQGAFPKAGVTLVQALRDPPTDDSTCEAVGQLSKPLEEAPVVLITGSRATLVSSRKLVFTGLQLSFGNFLDDAHEAFLRLQRAATAVEPLEAPVQVNVFSLDPSGSSAFRKTTSVPPSTLTLQPIEGLPSIDASAGIEAVMAPDVQAPLPR